MPSISKSKNSIILRNYRKQTKKSSKVFNTHSSMQRFSLNERASKSRKENNQSPDTIHSFTIKG